MKTLVFITAHFPFGNGESFIESEYPFLEANFDKIIIISQNTSDKRTRKVSEKTKIYRYDTATSLKGFISLPFLIISNSKLILNLIREEVLFRKGTSKITFISSFYLIKKITKAIQLRNFIYKVLGENDIIDNVVFYSYWLKTGAHAVSLINYGRSIKIARAHGSDIYEEKTKSKFLPLLSSTASRLDALFFISGNGKSYFKNKVGNAGNTYLSYLGVHNREPGKTGSENSDNFVIISCSNIIPLKRIDLIIKALEKTEFKRKTIWMHFGEGPLLNEMEELAKSMLSKLENLSYKFMGQFQNEKLMDFYRSNRIDLFLNTSITEGLPVSMMEVQSFGIPIIATDVGGVSEIVDEETGTILPVNFELVQLSEAISYYSGLDDYQRETLRKNITENWKKKFNAETNYQGFINTVNNIFELHNSIQKNEN